MPVMRVNKNKNYTTMSNTHLRDKNLSLKARGLLSTILSLPDNWSYSIAGLVSICKENESAIKSTLSELKETGYMVVEKMYSDENETKKFQYIYNIFENPEDSKELREKIKQKEQKRKARGENPPVEKPSMENPPVESRPLNKYTEELNTEELNTKELSTDNINAFNSKELKEDYINASFPEKKRTQTPFLDMNNCTLEEIENHYHIRCKKIAEKHNITDAEKIRDAARTITYFCQKYYEVFREPHPVLSDRALERVFINFCFPPELLDENGIVEYEDYKEMIDRYFATEYGKYNLSGIVSDYSISHFMSEEILTNLCKNVFGIPHL